ncbi:MAG TPA: YciI family protein [Pseudomonadales bacterium]|nr:YciI family protein [Pseudomonadales bacterium]
MLFLISLEYLRPLTEVDAHLVGHRAFLARHFEAGHFLLSGPKVPRTGGLILAQADSREALEAWLDEDPFRHYGLARFDVTGWEPTMKNAAFERALHQP